MSRKSKSSIPEPEDSGSDDSRIESNQRHREYNGDLPDILPLNPAQKATDSIPAEDSQQRGLFESQSDRLATKGHRSVWGGANGARLITLCLMLVMVIYAMQHAAKPESWNWLINLDKGNLRQDGDANLNGGANLNNGLESTNEANHSFVSPPGPGTPVRDREAVKSDDTDATNRPNDDAGKPILSQANTSSIDFWTGVLQSLDGRQQLRLFNLFQAAVRQQSLKTGETSAAEKVWAIVETRFQQFRTSQSKNASDKSLKMFFDRWDNSIVPAVKAVLRDRPQKQLVDGHLKQLSKDVSAAARRLIRDKTPVERVQESYAWFAAWANVYDSPIDPDAGQAATVTQLLAQPTVWRGRSVKVTGTALRTERVPASHNALGIERYFVVWIKPDHPSSFPLCVYTLTAPEALMGEPDQRMREINQPVSATATFYKNRLFDAGHAAVAPVLLTSSIQIPAKVVAQKRKFRLPGLGITLVTVAVVASMSCLIAVTVYRTTLGGKSRALPRKENLANQFQELSQDERVETTSEKLKRLGMKTTDQPTKPDIEPKRSGSQDG